MSHQMAPQFCRISRIVLGFAFVVLLASSAIAENWPRFRGPTGNGLSSEKNLPRQWSETSNIVWKTPIPGEGWSSPIVFGDRVFVTSTTEEGARCHVSCVDRESGKLLWSSLVEEQSPTRKEMQNSFATPTPVTDGKSVFAVFSGGTIVAIDFDGKVLWRNREIRFFSKHGLGASPILDGELLIMPFDGSANAEGEGRTIGWKIPWDKAVLLAVDKSSGETIWRGLRGSSRIAHVTPNVLVRNGRKQIVSGAGDVVQGFDPATGARLWTLYSQGEGVTPSIVLGDELVYTCSGFEQPTIRAVRPDGEGDVTKTHIAWEQTRGVPSLASLLYVQPYLYAVTDAGVATCYDGKTGDVVWQERIGGKHSSSPVFADGAIYFLSEEGESTLIEPGPEFKILQRNQLDEICKATMAVSQGSLFIRGERHLYRIGQ